MISKSLMVMVCVVAVSFLSTGFCLGGDLDDGISKYTDGSIAKEDSLGKPDKNLKFIVLDAIMKAKNQGPSEGQDKNTNSIVIGAGANLAGATIINVVEEPAGASSDDKKKRP